jgi:phosphoadenosine phosphosulfate reductase
MFTHLEGQPIIFLFSAGKDAIVTGDILRQKYDGPIHWVYLYFVEGLSFVDSIIRHYEKRWNIKIHQFPCAETLSVLARRIRSDKMRYEMNNVETQLRKHFGCEWIATGMKRNDSLSRLGMMQSCEGIFDHKYKKMHPVIDWSDKKIMAYINLHHLPLPVTYRMGFRRSLWTINASVLVWMKDAFPEDYKRIMEYLPEYGDAVYRMEGSV